MASSATPSVSTSKTAPPVKRQPPPPRTGSARPKSSSRANRTKPSSAGAAPTSVGSGRTKVRPTRVPVESSTSVTGADSTAPTDPKIVPEAIQPTRPTRLVSTVSVERLKVLNDDSNLREQIANIARIEPSVPWVITDANLDETLFMIHHGLDHDKIPFVREAPDRVPRGVVIDLKKRVVIARGYPKEHRVTMSEVKPEANLLEIWDNEEVIHNFDLSDSADQFKITPAMDGFVILVYKHNGVIYHSTYKLLDADRAHIGQSQSFLELYYACGGPPGDFLFDPSEAYSPYVYIFLVAAPQLAIATRQFSNNGYVAWLGTKKMWPSGFYEGTESARRVDFEAFETQFGRFQLERAGTVTPVTGSTTTSGQTNQVIYLRSDALGREVIDQPFVYVPPRLTLGEANYHLRYGYLPSRDKTVLAAHEAELDELYQVDPRAVPGEQIFLLSLKETGETYDLIQIQSRAYVYRELIRQKVRNLNFDFANLLSEGYQIYHNKGMEALMRTFVLPESVPLNTVKLELAKGPKYNLPMAITKRGARNLQTGELVYTYSNHYNMKTKFTNPTLKQLLFLTYLYGLPPTLQLSATNVLDHYNADVNTVRNWLSWDEGLTDRIKAVDSKNKRYRGFEPIVQLVHTQANRLQSKYQEKKRASGKTVKVAAGSLRYNWPSALNLALEGTDPVIIYQAARFINRLTTAE